MPRKSQQSIQHAADRRLAEAARGSERFAELQLDWIDYSGRRLARFGGVWDKDAREYIGDAQRSRVVRMHPGQVEAARWFDAWLAEHLGDAKRTAVSDVRHALLAGGRRGGKTTFAIDVAVAYAIAAPESEVWIVTPSDAFYDEPLDYLERAMPRYWFESLGAPHWSFYLLNGSTISMRSGYTPRKLKRGRADLVVINEAQQIEEQAMTTVQASTIDVGGLVVSAANPPDVGDPGAWVAEMAAEAERGLRKHARYFFFNPEKNPEIDHSALHAMRELMSDHEYQVQILGRFLLPPDAVLYAWDNGPHGNEMPAPELGRDITREFTRHYEGRALGDMLAIDVQNYPWHAAIRFRAFENPTYPGDVEQALLWGVGEVFLEKGDEVQLAEECAHLVFRGQRLKPDDCLVVMDASADWQQATRDTFKQRKEYKGKGSMDIFRQCGYLDVVPPDRYMKRNPEVADRCRGANARICTASGRRMVFVDPELCPNTIASIRKWRTRGGMPSRRSDAAHGGDALTYLIWRFFPRRRRGGKVDVSADAAQSSSSSPRFGGRNRFRGF